MSRVRGRAKARSPEAWLRPQRSLKLANPSPALAVRSPFLGVRFWDQGEFAGRGACRCLGEVTTKTKPRLKRALRLTLKPNARVSFSTPAMTPIKAIEVSRNHS